MSEVKNVETEVIEVEAELIEEDGSSKKLSKKIKVVLALAAGAAVTALIGAIAKGCFEDTSVEIIETEDGFSVVEAKDDDDDDDEDEDDDE